MGLGLRAAGVANHAPDQIAQAGELHRPAAWQSDERVWADLAHALWNSKEFLFVR